MAQSVILRRSLGIQWGVNNFFSVDRVETQAFSFNGLKWMFLVKRCLEESEWVAVDILGINARGTLLNKIRINTSIEDRNEGSRFSMECIIPQHNVCRVWCKKIEDLKKKVNTILTNGAVIFVCVLTEEAMRGDYIEREESTQTAENMDPMVWFESLSRDFHHLLDDNLLSDVTLKCGDRTIPAHRNVLSARSEVFLAMFRSDMTESRTGIIEISDIEPSTLYQLVQYIYSGKVSDLSADSAVVLYAAADKYAVDSLKQLCGNFMRDNLTEENACNFLALVDAHGDKDMKNYVLSFIMERELLKDEERWRKFLKEHPVLAAEALHHAYKAK